MARNMKPEYIRKLMKLEVPKGYKFDVANYLHNPSYSFEYPSFCKVVSEDENNIVERRVYFMKYYGGEGEYIEQYLTFAKGESETGWKIAKSTTENVLEKSNRFNLKKLISLI